MLPPREFLKEIKPFKFLTKEELDLLVKNLEVEGFEEGEVLFGEGQKTKYVYIIFSGLIGLYEDDKLIDHMTKGDIIGIGLEGGIVQYTAKAEEDTICYLIKKDAFNKILERNDKFSEFFRSFVDRRFRRFREIATESAFEERLFLTKVRSLITKEPVVCSPITSVRDAAIKMELNAVGSIVVVTDTMKPIGILTDHDLKKFIIHGKSPEERVSAYMSSPPICIEGEKPLFEAYVELLKKGINHLIVTEEGKVSGVITSKDVLGEFEPSTSLVALYRKIRKSRNLLEMSEIFHELIKAISLLVLKGMHFYDLSTMITGIYDYTVTNVIEIVRRDFEREVGRLPDFLWVHMGSSARKEQIIATDQDNAMIHEGDGQILLEFAKKVNDALNFVGIPKCPGNYMASNPNWNKSIDSWKRMFEEWFEELIPENVRYLSIFLDLRPIYGEFKFHHELIEHIYEKRTMQSLRYLALDASALEPPTGIFGMRRLKEIDLKRYGIYPLANGVRVLSLEKNIIEITNTKERIEKLIEIELIEDKTGRDLLESYEFFQDLRLKFQAKSLVEDYEKKSYNVIKVADLDKIEIFVLRECFKIISDFQKFLKGRFAIERGI
mgnify:CR=1 FL=1